MEIGNASREAITKMRWMPSQVSVGQLLGAWAALLVGGLLGGLLAILMLDKPFGIPVAALVGYTGAVFFFLFRDYEPSDGEAFSLRQKAVRQEIPRLLAIHAVFLVVVFIVLTIALSLRPFLPPSWFVRGGKRRSTAEWLLILIVSVPIWMQVSISRRILSRSVKADQANSPSLTLE